MPTLRNPKLNTFLRNLLADIQRPDGKPRPPSPRALQQLCLWIVKTEPTKKQ